MSTVLYVILFFIYAGFGAYVWGFWQNRPNDEYPIKKELSILAPVLLVHSWLIWSPILSGHMVLLGFGAALNLIIWLMLLMYFCGNFFYSLKGLQILLYPLASLSLLVAILLPGETSGYPIQDIPFIIHIASSILAYCLFAIAALFAVLIFLVERDLRLRKFSALMRFLPSLLSLEKLMFQAIWAGFILLSISVATGTIFSESVFHKPFEWTHKSIFGVFSWVIYAILILCRMLLSWRGKKAVWLALIGFVSLMFAYVGSKFILALLG